MKEKTKTEIKTHIKELGIGVVGVIVGYDRSYGGYKGKLNMMGLTPGTQFVVLNINSQQDTIQIMLDNRIIKLSKPEANALCVEEMTDSDSTMNG